MTDVDVRGRLDQAKETAYSAADTVKGRASEYATAAQDTATGYASKATDTAKEALQPLLGTTAGYGSRTEEEVSRLMADLPKQIEQPYRPRDNIVPSKERPEGHYATPPGRTPLQQHLDYFDLDKNGVIYPWETFFALRYLKFAWEPFNTIISFWLTALFHVAFSYQTQSSWLPSPVWSIITKNARMTKHGASSGSYDHNGHFIPGKFEEIFARFDSGGRGRLSVVDVVTLVWSKAQWNNPFGTFFTALQWAITLWVFHDDNWQLRKNDVRGLYDGTAFYRLADRNGNPWYGMARRRDAVDQKKMG